MSVILVTWNEVEMVRRCLPSLLPHLRPGDELIVADNASTDGTPEAVAEIAPQARLIRMPENRGYMIACNEAGRLATGDLILLLDADTVVAPGFGEAIRRPLTDGRGWAAWMGLLTMDGGRLVNTSGGVVHFTGISWAGEVGRPVAEANGRPREVPFLTGACMAVARETWERHGGFPPDYFLYFDDVDFSLRVRLAGGRIGLEPSARVDHLYDFSRRAVRWRLLERNRWATILRTYPAPLLALLAPALLATEIALLAVSVRNGWARHKLLAAADTVRALPRLLRERREIQAERRVSAGEFARYLTAELSSPYLGSLAQRGPVRVALRAYWRAVCAVLRAPSPAT